LGTIFQSALDGSVGVFPPQSMVTYCNTNASGLYREFNSASLNLKALKLNEAAKSIKLLLKHFSSSVFFCYYTITDTGRAA
jgi:hypothetical protein